MKRKHCRELTGTQGQKLELILGWKNLKSEIRSEKRTQGLRGNEAR